MVINCIKDVLDDDRVSEIVIVDDASTDECYAQLSDLISALDNEKVYLYQNPKNLDCYLNKKRSVELASNPWVIVFDSDNIMTKKYVDVICGERWYGAWDKNVVYQPQFARPLFDFKFLAGVTLDRSIVGFWLDRNMTETMLNAMNYFVNKHEYLRVFDDKIDPVTSDSLYQNYRWLEAGNSIYVTPGLEYDHTIHKGSHYQNNHKRTPQGFHEEILAKLRAMK
jgi:glycosyltransferase involved in cell wall biosynthesis